MKFFGVLRGIFFKKSPKQGVGQSPKNKITRLPAGRFY